MNGLTFAKGASKQALCQKQSEGTISLVLLPYAKGLLKKREVS
jgi:hypothetical protein